MDFQKYISILNPLDLRLRIKCMLLWFVFSKLVSTQSCNLNQVRPGVFSGFENEALFLELYSISSWLLFLEFPYTVNVVLE